MENKPIVFSTLLANTEAIEKITQFKILSDFLSSSLLYCYQNIGQNIPNEESEAIKSKLSQHQKIVQHALGKYK